MTDDQRIESIKKILHHMNKPANIPQGLSREQYQKYKRDVLFDITDRYPNVNENTTETERFFMIKGKDIAKTGMQWSCGTVAKLFCYLNEGLPPDEQLDTKIMISTHPDHLIDSMSNHTLPCVKMGDGKDARYYAIEPSRNVIENRPRHPKYPEIPFILDDIKVGGDIHHIKPHCCDKPYKIAAIMSYSEYEQNMSDFGQFLRTASVRDETTQKIVEDIEKILTRINANGIRGTVYSFCKNIVDSDLPIKAVYFRSCPELMIEMAGGIYRFAPVRTYLMLHRLQKLSDNKFLDMDSETECMLKYEYTPSEYIEYFEQNKTCTGI